jgi:hypothetical protein
MVPLQTIIIERTTRINSSRSFKVTLISNELSSRARVIICCAKILNFDLLLWSSDFEFHIPKLHSTLALPMSTSSPPLFKNTVDIRYYYYYRSVSTKTNNITPEHQHDPDSSRRMQSDHRPAKSYAYIMQQTMFLV